jgi:hypothetical protein
MNWSRAHWLVGVATLVAFPLAGVYMRYVALVPELADAPRLVYRSRFLLLLMIALTNLALSRTQPRGLLQCLASIVILAAPPLIAAAFFIDPARGVHGSLWTATTMRALFGAALLLAIAHRPWSAPKR